MAKIGMIFREHSDLKLIFIALALIKLTFSQYLENFELNYLPMSEQPPVSLPRPGSPGLCAN